MKSLKLSKSLLLTITLSVSLLSGCTSVHTFQHDGRNVAVRNPTEIKHNGETYIVALSTKTKYKKEIDLILNSRLESKQKQTILYALPYVDEDKRKELLESLSLTLK